MSDDQNNQQGPTPPPGDQGQPPKDGMAEIKKKIEEAKRKEEEATNRQDAESAQHVVEQITTLKIALNDANNKALRALADLQNARKRMEEEKATFATFATKNVVLEVIDMLENFERSMAHKPDTLKDGDWLKGLELLSAQFQKFFSIHGVKKLEAKAGDRVDPAKHEAVMASEGEEGVILEVFSTGYEMGGRVIRTAKVKVGSGKKS